MNSQAPVSPNNKIMNEQLTKLEKIAFSYISDEDIAHRGFFLPFEIALKTYQTQMIDSMQQNYQHKQQSNNLSQKYRSTILNNDSKNYIKKNQKLKPGSLPDGLKIAVKTGLQSERRILKNLQKFEDNQQQKSLQLQLECIKQKKYFIQKHQAGQDLNVLKQQIFNLQQKLKSNHKKAKLSKLKIGNQDNLLSLMKHQQGLQLAICICMYSEDRKMLKRTLEGVSQNIANMVAYQNISPDKIGVFVIMDGIEKVDDSVVDYFQQLEHSCGMRLGDNIAPQMSPEELVKRSHMDQDQILRQQAKNINSYLFNPIQLGERNALRFPSVRANYFQVINIQKQIQQLEKKDVLYNNLSGNLQTFFLQEARKQRKNQYAQNDEDIKSQQLLISQYAYDVRKYRPLLMRALNQAKTYCKNFKIVRENLAYLACFRWKIPYSEQILSQHKKKHTQNQQYKDQKQTSTYEIFDGNIQINQMAIMNLFMCVKYKNSGKISSHNWFFNGFCKQLRPKYTVLLDVGLRPQKMALMKMYKYLVNNHKTIGGICGYMSLKRQQIQESQQISDQSVDCLTRIFSLFVDIQKTQQVQYHFAHLIDKAFQALFGFIHVLPGAFSAYNMKAIIQYDKADDELLQSYFQSINNKVQNSSIIPSNFSVKQILLRTFLPSFINKCFIKIDPNSQEAMLYNENVYLAEDRILCMQIFKKGFQMAYLPDAYAQVDPIKHVDKLMSQRKRWINGSEFAFEKVKKELQIHQQDIGCKLSLHLQIIYLSFMNSLSYFSPALFLFTVHIAMDAFRSNILTNVLSGVITNPQQNQFLKSFVYTMDFIFVMLIMTIVFFSIHFPSNNKKFTPYIYAISTLLGIFMICVFVVLVVDILNGLLNDAAFLAQNAKLISTIPGGQNTINAMRWGLIASILIYILPISIYLIFFGRLQILCQIIKGSLSFLFYGPTYLIILNIYSICRIDDISWGTKGLNQTSTKDSNLKYSWRIIKLIHVAKYVIGNIVLGIVLLNLGQDYTNRFMVTILMVALVGIFIGIKVLFACIYMISYKIKNAQDLKQPNLNVHSAVQNKIYYYKQQILQQIRGNLQEILKVSKQNQNNFQQGISFIRALKDKKLIKASYIRQSEEKKSRSKIYKKSRFSKVGKPSIMKEKDLYDDSGQASQQVLNNEPYMYNEIQNVQMNRDFLINLKPKQKNKDTYESPFSLISSIPKRQNNQVQKNKDPKKKWKKQTK